MTWAILGTIAVLITLLNVVPEVPGVINSYLSASNDEAEAKKLQAEEQVIEAKNRRNKAVWRGVIITASILSAGITAYKLLFSGKVKRSFKKRKK